MLHETCIAGYMGTLQVLSFELTNLSSCLLKDLVFSSGLLSSESRLVQGSCLEGFHS